MSDTTTSFTTSVHIEASPEEVFALATDFGRAKEVIRAIEKVELLTDGPIGVGTRFLETRTVLGHETTQEMEVTAFDPPRLYALGCESHGARYLTEVRLAPNRSGTEVELRFEAQPLTFMAKAMAEMLKPMIDSVAGVLENDLEDLKTALERPSRDI
jgi:hypothetical protein